MVCGILFDLDRTLLDRDLSFFQFTHRQYERFSNILSSVPMEDYVNHLITLDNYGYNSKTQAYSTLVEDLHLPTRLVDEFIADYEQDYPLNASLFPEVATTLRKLKEMGIKVGLISNGTATLQNTKIDVLGIRSYFDDIAISQSEGVRKPSVEIFHRALQRLKCEARNCIYVGDHPVNDVLGSKNAGMYSIWRQSDPWPRPAQADASIQNLSELLDLISQIPSPATP